MVSFSTGLAGNLPYRCQKLADSIPNSISTCTDRPSGRFSSSAPIRVSTRQTSDSCAHYLRKSGRSGSDQSPVRLSGLRCRLVASKIWTVRGWSVSCGISRLGYWVAVPPLVFSSRAGSHSTICGIKIMSTRNRIAIGRNQTRDMKMSLSVMS